MGKKNNRRMLARIDDWYGLQPLSRRRWKQILEVLGCTCLKCGAVPVTRDHIVPLARGGLNHPTNLQPLCHRCNARKGDTTVDYRTPEQLQVVLARWPLERIPIENYTRPGPMRASLAQRRLCRPRTS